MITFVLSASSQCNSRVTSFSPGERITYQAYYNWGFIWIHAGDLLFSVDQIKYDNKDVYDFEAVGNSLTSYDWAYKVRDKYQSLVDKETYSPLYFEQNTSEGGYKVHQTYQFSDKAQKIYRSFESSKKPNTKDSVNLSSCTLDVLSAIYYCRNIDYSKCRINDKIPFNLAIDNKIYPLYLRYLGKENLHIHDGKQEFQCVKFSVLLVEGTAFKGGEDMVIHVTDDDNRIPVLVEARILIGSVKAYLNTAKGLRNPENARIK